MIQLNPYKTMPVKHLTADCLNRASCRLLETDAFSEPAKYKVLISIPSKGINPIWVRKNDTIEVLLSLEEGFADDGEPCIVAHNITEREKPGAPFWRVLTGFYPDETDAFVAKIYQKIAKTLQHEHLWHKHFQMLHFEKEAALF